MAEEGAGVEITGGGGQRMYGARAHVGALGGSHEERGTECCLIINLTDNSKL